jgi:hypothetical protein
MNIYAETTYVCSVVDQHRVDADPDPDPDWHQNDADPHADPTLSSTHVGKSHLVLLMVTLRALPIKKVYLSHQCQMFIIVNSIFKFSRKKFSLLTFSFVWN